MNTSLWIVGYVVMYVVTYYYARWYHKKYEKLWNWDLIKFTIWFCLVWPFYVISITIALIDWQDLGNPPKWL